MRAELVEVMEAAISDNVMLSIDASFRDPDGTTRAAEAALDALLTWLEAHAWSGEEGRSMVFVADLLAVLREEEEE